jgi:hypothetical protein
MDGVRCRLQSIRCCKSSSALDTRVFRPADTRMHHQIVSDPALHGKELAGGILVPVAQRDIIWLRCDPAATIVASRPELGTISCHLVYCMSTQ